MELRTSELSWLRTVWCPLFHSCTQSKGGQLGYNMHVLCGGGGGDGKVCVGEGGGVGENHEPQSFNGFKQSGAP